MENSYGIGITNRYDLFCMDDDANDMESILSKKAKQQKKAAAKAAAASANEKENKVAATVIKPLQSAAPVKGTQQQNGQPPKSTRPIKETQNIRSNSDKGPREGNRQSIFLRNFHRLFLICLINPVFIRVEKYWNNSVQGFYR